MVSKPCLSCGQAGPRARCDDCQRAVWRARGSGHARGYTRKWREISKRQRRRVPWCEIKLPGCTLLATAADHVVPLEDGGRSVASNARSACTNCNNRRRYMESPNDPANV